MLKKVLKGLGIFLLVTIIALAAAPFLFKDKIKEMSIEDKIGQLFFVVGQDSDTVNLSEFTKKYRPGGIMYRPDKAAKIKDEVSKLQKASDIPLFIAGMIGALMLY